MGRKLRGRGCLSPTAGQSLGIPQAGGGAGGGGVWKHQLGRAMPGTAGLREPQEEARAAITPPTSANSSRPRLLCGAFRRGARLFLAEVPPPLRPPAGTQGAGPRRRRANSSAEGAGPGTPLVRNALYCAERGGLQPPWSKPGHQEHSLPEMIQGLSGGNLAPAHRGLKVRQVTSPTRGPVCGPLTYVAPERERWVRGQAGSGQAATVMNVEPSRTPRPPPPPAAATPPAPAAS